MRACYTAPGAAATPHQHLPCLGNAAGQLPTAAGRQWRRWCRLASTAGGAADHHRARRLPEPWRDSHRASPAPLPLADMTAATAPNTPKMPCSSDVVSCSNMSSILCDTHAADARVRTGTWIRHVRARSRIGGGLLGQADRTVWSAVGSSCKRWNREEVVGHTARRRLEVDFTSAARGRPCQRCAIHLRRTVMAGASRRRTNGSAGGCVQVMGEV